MSSVVIHGGGGAEVIISGPAVLGTNGMNSKEEKEIVFCRLFFSQVSTGIVTESNLALIFESVFALAPALLEENIIGALSVISISFAYSKQQGS
jgi:hypothetical protein